MLYKRSTLNNNKQPKNLLKAPPNSPCSRTLTGSVWGTGDEGQEPRICVLLIVSFAEGVEYRFFWVHKEFKRSMETRIVWIEVLKSPRRNAQV